MKKQKYKARASEGKVATTVIGEDRIEALEEIMGLISKGYGKPTYSGAINWLVDKFIDDKIIID